MLRDIQDLKMTYCMLFLCQNIFLFSEFGKNRKKTTTITWLISAHDTEKEKRIR